MKKTISQRLAAAELRQARAAAQVARIKVKKVVADRKLDTRRKVIVGAAVLVEMERTPQFANFVRAMLEKTVTRPHDRQAIAGLFQVAAEVTTPAVNGNSSTPAGAEAHTPSPGKASARFGVTTREKLVT